LRKNPAAWENRAKGDGTKFRRIDNSPQYDSFEELVHDLKRRYQKTHPGETEGLHYEFRAITRDMRSGFIKAERLEALATGPNPPTEALLIENNRVVGYETEEQGPLSWLEGLC
jgi:hypothetical protein